MSKVLFFDTFNGVSGDMILGALIHLGLPLEHLKTQLGGIELPEFELRAEPVERLGIAGINFQVRVPVPSEKHVHPHHGIHGASTVSHGRSFAEILSILQRSRLHPWVLEKSISIFMRLAEAEARMHGCSPENVHFHEVGAADAIVDIVGACIGFHYFGVDRFFTAPLHLGGGTVTFSHGTWPVPAPATAELVRGFPVLMDDALGELTTPTGAAIVTTLAEASKPTFPVAIEACGFGAGDREYPNISNMLRLILAQERQEKESSASSPSYALEAGMAEEIILLEASIDDLDPETLGYFMEKALSLGALEVYYTPLHMKKSRPGVLLSLLCRPQDHDKMSELVFCETTTLGLRWSRWKRQILKREIKEIQTEYGQVRLKIGRLHGRVVNVSPEYEDLKAICERERVPMKVIRQKIFEWTKGFI
ncbi:MAG: nickel pincer cofactor biosynthesis protein LarC [Acidobacteria bacterium]|nr:nickel pincer cofactor biosynthesis protein LarC [Acidobacteriota bacterium]